MVSGLKDCPLVSDPSGMGIPDLECPICNADLPLAGDEKVGDEVFCTYCGAPSKLKGAPDSDPEDWEAEEDF